MKSYLLMMTGLFLKLLLSFFLIMVPSLALGEELFTHKGISVNTDKNYQCGKNINVQLKLKSNEQVLKSRIDMQELSNMTKTYLWLDCNNIETITYKGYIENQKQPTYQAVAKKVNNWFLDSSAETNISAPTDKYNKKELSPSPKISNSTVISKKLEKLSTQKDLERAAQSGSLHALLELAKGLLNLSDADNNVQFDKDTQKGLDILADLAAQGNQDAKHLIGQAYLSNPTLQPDISLLEKISQGLSENPTDQRQNIAGRLTIEAAAKGSREAIKALNIAGQEGSNMAYYALALMYLFDEQKEMPTDKEFLIGDLDLDETETEGFGSSDVGQHFLSLAAQSGNNEAQRILNDLGEKTTASPMNKQPSTKSKVAASLEPFSNQQLSETIEGAQGGSPNYSQGASTSGEKTSQGNNTATENAQTSKSTGANSVNSQISKKQEEKKGTSSQPGKSHRVIEFLD